MYPVADPRLPLDQAAFRRTLSPEEMVRTRVCIGGPLPEEVRRMLGEARKALAADRSWVGKRRQTLTASEAKLNLAFDALRKR